MVTCSGHIHRYFYFEFVSSKDILNNNFVNNELLEKIHNTYIVQIIRGINPFVII